MLPLQEVRFRVEASQKMLKELLYEHETSRVLELHEHDMDPAHELGPGVWDWDYPETC